MAVVQLTGRPDGQSNQQQQPEENYPSRADRTKVTLRLRAGSAARAALWCARGRGRFLQDLVSDLIDQHLTVDGQTATMINDLTDRDDLHDDEVRRFLKPSHHENQKSGGRPDGQGASAPISTQELEALPEPEREVLKFYTSYCITPAKQRDRITYAAVAHFPLHVIKVGILMSALRANKRINSLRYCVGAIEEASDPDVGPGYLDYLIEHWRRHRGQPTLPNIGGDLVEYVQRPKV